MKLEILNLEKSFNKKKIISNLSCNLTTGVYGLLGINGVGKTTLMRMLCTLIRPDSGTIKLDGNDIYEMGDDYRKIIGYLPQDFGYYPELTIQRYMMYISSIKGLQKRYAKKKTAMLLEMLGLADKKNIKMHKLSGGMKRRVGIAQALLNDPKILILDEPTAGLDPNERIRFRKIINEISKERLVLLSTHIVSDIDYIADEIILMREGKIIFYGKPTEMIKSMDKNVYECIISDDMLDFYQENYIIANIKTVNQGVEIRVISESIPLKNGVMVDATMEDAFIWNFADLTKEKNINDKK